MMHAYPAMSDVTQSSSRHRSRAALRKPNPAVCAPAMDFYRQEDHVDTWQELVLASLTLLLLHLLQHTVVWRTNMHAFTQSHALRGYLEMQEKCAGIDDDSGALCAVVGVAHGFFGLALRRARKAAPCAGALAQVVRHRSADPTRASVASSSGRRRCCVWHKVDGDPGVS